MNRAINKTLWDKCFDLSLGHIKSFTYNGKKYEAPNDGDGYKKRSAYSTGWAVKLYNSLGGGWKKTSHLIVASRVSASITADLGEWFGKEDWVAIDTDGSIIGPCAQSHRYPKSTNKGQDPHKCLPRAKAKSMTKAERAESARKKRDMEKKHPDHKNKEPAFSRTK